MKFAIPIPAIRQIFIDDSDFNLQARDCMAGIAREASRCNNGTITFSAFMTYARDMLIQQLSMDRYDADFYIDLCNDIIEGTSCLGTFQVKQYAFSFSNIVNNSNLDQETREDVYSLSNILFSSILCWQ